MTSTSPLKIHDSELDYDENLVYTYHGNLFTGIGFDDSSQGRAEITYVQGRQEGPASEWFTSGQLKEESNYVNNALHGPSREFDIEGRLLEERWYEFGILVRSTRWDVENNEVVRHFEISQSAPEYLLLQRYRQATGSS